MLLWGRNQPKWNITKTKLSATRLGIFGSIVTHRTFFTLLDRRVNILLFFCPTGIYIQLWILRRLCWSENTERGSESEYWKVMKFSLDYTIKGFSFIVWIKVIYYYSLLLVIEYQSVNFFQVLGGYIKLINSELASSLYIQWTCTWITSYQLSAGQM